MEGGGRGVETRAIYQGKVLPNKGKLMNSYRSVTSYVLRGKPIRGLATRWTCESLKGREVPHNLSRFVSSPPSKKSMQTPDVNDITHLHGY